MPVASWNPFEALATSFKEGWEWFTGGFANPFVYSGIEPPKPAPAPGVPSGAYVAPYQPTPEEIIEAQRTGIETWRVTAIPGVDNSSLTWILVGGVLLLLVVKKR